MMFDEVMELIGKWGGTLKFFPSDTDARIGIAEELVAMAGDNIGMVRWIIGEAPKIWADWPGMLEMRALFCTQFYPRDKRETISTAVDRHVESSHPPERLQLAGDMKPLDADPFFPRDSLSLIADAGRKRALPLTIKAATNAEIQAIKAAQERNRKGSAA